MRSWSLVPPQLDFLAWPGFTSPLTSPFKSSLQAHVRAWRLHGSISWAGRASTSPPDSIHIASRSSFQSLATPQLQFLVWLGSNFPLNFFLQIAPQSSFPNLHAAISWSGRASTSQFTSLVKSRLKAHFPALAPPRFHFLVWPGLHFPMNFSIYLYGSITWSGRTSPSLLTSLSKSSLQAHFRAWRLYQLQLF
jgi:hypothetical protein